MAEQRPIVTEEELSDDALFEGAMEPDTPDPAPQDPAKEEEPEAREDGRDDQGRFAAKDKEEDPEKAEVQPEPQEPEPTPEPQPDDYAKQGWVPSGVHREANEQRRRAEEELASERARTSGLEQQVQAISQQLRQIQEHNKQPEEPIDPFADPQGWEKNVHSTFEQKLRAHEANVSFRLAHREHGEKFSQAWQEMETRANRGDRSIAQSVMNSPDPGQALVDWYTRESTLQAVGPDPDAFVQKKLDEALKDPQFLAKAVEAAKAQATTGNGQQPPAQGQVDLPPSLTKATTAAPAKDGVTDMSDAAIFQDATAGR